MDVMRRLTVLAMFAISTVASAQTTTGYRGMTVREPAPTGAAGLAWQNNFKALADRLGNHFQVDGDPTANDDEADTAGNGAAMYLSTWRNTVDGGLWICVDASTGAADWCELFASSDGGTLTINQVADDSGLSIYGYDDQSAEYVKLSLGASGATTLETSDHLFIDSGTGQIYAYSSTQMDLQYAQSANAAFFRGTSGTPSLYIYGQSNKYSRQYVDSAGDFIWTAPSGGNLSIYSDGGHLTLDADGSLTLPSDNQQLGFGAAGIADSYIRYTGLALDIQSATAIDLQQNTRLKSGKGLYFQDTDNGSKRTLIYQGGTQWIVAPDAGCTSMLFNAAYRDCDLIVYGDTQEQLRVDAGADQITIGGSVRVNESAVGTGLYVYGAGADSAYYKHEYVTTGGIAWTYANGPGLRSATPGYMIQSAGTYWNHVAGTHAYIDLGGTLYVRDYDASNATRFSIDSATGTVSLPADGQKLTFGAAGTPDSYIEYTGSYLHQYAAGGIRFGGTLAYGTNPNSDYAAYFRTTASGQTGVYGYSDDAYGLQGYSGTSTGIRGIGVTGCGVQGITTDSIGVYGSSTNYVGVYGTTNSGTYSGYFYKNHAGAAGSSVVFALSDNASDIRPLYFGRHDGSGDLINLANNGSPANEMFVVENDGDIDAEGNLTIAPDASVTPVNNGDVVFEFTNNTTLTVKAKGSDGTVRAVALTLAP